MLSEIETLEGVDFLTPNVPFLDASNAADFKSAVMPAISASKATIIVIDLTSVEFMDSMGLGALVACLRRTEAQKQRLQLCNLKPKVRALFELVRLYKVFEIFNTRAECVRASTH